MNFNNESRNQKRWGIMNRAINQVEKRIILIIAFLAVTSVWSQTINQQQSLLEEAKTYDLKVGELLKLNATEQKTKINAMPINEAIALKDAALRRLTKSNSEANTVFYLYEHLAAIQANNLAEKRLERLMAVLVITLLLFGGYLVYLLLAQNRTIRQLKQIESQLPLATNQVKKEQSIVYRGE